ncbi:cobaltochelatase subunit CobN [Halobacterium salinarum]|uniref:ATP-dependent cobaltochelatase subunit CobN n=1 Tax=Halobacterium salinarum (strain ATCC 33171 / DSM 3754 / JCM 8978 / NBRC 102687 / NCIMB 764 / 91-R6) TaxID=2597657 RepID=A0A4D6GW65_HALS9|nr:cobaltochelatase subunit CobN [Halobacterium salinarum]MDL0140557.1 cobaltochelatase subunit CobN [Halobacterium salinarum]MDL0145871.1 cobaltochelatase subunit CobN [Halobacterium salinarum]QCC45306.1 ATP-dependent cobaltochelatase subunit CobN [Halobacterium salinarum]TYO81575.1 cobaltochelatase CobN subunit [Halobacterium salinarum DSM 3754]
MTVLALYTATENELGAVQAAAGRVDVDLVARSESDLDDETAVEAFLDTAADADAAVFWLHGAEDSMPGYDRATARLADAGVPLVVKSTGDAYAVEDTTVAAEDRDTVYEYLDRGGSANVANCLRFLGDRYSGTEFAYDDPVALPTEGVYHPDHPGIDYDGLRATFDPDAPTVAVWFYESHWTHENTRYVDGVVHALESQGANALPVFCNPATDTDEQEDAEWVTDQWLLADGEPVVDAVVSSFMFSLSMDERGRSASDEGDAAEDVFLDRLGVPVLQTVTTMRSRSRYESADTGVMGFELALSVALPEFDGNVITHPISGKERTDDDAGIGTAPKQHFPIADRVEHAASLAVNWARLRHLDNDEKRVAVVLHNYPPSDDGIGTAFGLDTPESTVNLLDELDARGYSLGGKTPPEGQALIEQLTSQLTLDDRWVAPEDVRERSVDVVSTDEYAAWWADTDPEFRANVVAEWGEPPERPFAIPGVEYGNVLVTVQPPRGFGMDPEKVYHDSDLQPPHDYYAFYAWLREEFGADAVVHLGTHGSLEWLPGKTVGLDAESAPDALLGDLPNVYPYIVNNPGEGTQAKRRSYAAVVDYLTPVMSNAGTYDELAELEELASRYREAGTGAGADAESHIADRIREQVADLDLAVELGIEGEISEKADVRGPDAAGSSLAEGAVDGDTVGIEALVERVHEYVTDVKTTQIRLGLHTMGEPPADDRLVEYLVALTRLENPGAPSLRESVAGVLGVDYETMLDSPGEYSEALGMTYAEAADEVYETSVDLVETLAAEGFDVPASNVAAGPDDEVNMNLLVVDIDTIGDARAKSGAHDDLRAVLAFICEEAAPRVFGAESEIPQTADALDGEYVEPGGSGAPTRGGVDLLPTGRNFYTLDPRKVPARTAWDVGKEVADGVAQRHQEDEGEYPEEVGVVAWGTPTVRTRGETIAQVLGLMGVRPVWTDAGRVDDVEPIPLGDLGRPRIDVTTRVSGLFRDAFPQAAGVVHDAVDAVVDLDEPHDMNYVKKHVEAEAAELEAEGVENPEQAAKRRVFTTRPGGYGAGTNKAVDEGEWDDRSDLADVYVQWGGYAMGSRGRVSEAHDAFERRLGNVDATVKIEDTMEQDEFDSSDWYAFHGGFITAVAEESGAEPASYVGDSSDPDNVDVYTNEEKVRKAMRARVLNPEWLDSMEDHGYKGAGDLSSTVDVTLGWDATTGVVSDTLWADVAEKYAFDEDRQEWLRDVNPWALSSITDTLLEAIERDLWGADDETAERLRDLHLQVSGDLEARASGEHDTPADGDERETPLHDD